ncbi:MAG: 4-hydroxy-tetrahydrodipicolinate synthase [Bacteroidota bacterium]|nr:4-hydroxy-tetrahydrodipicolinate synthase [Bacteroidota bacterium]
MNNLKGTGVALVTPFKTNGDVDVDALKKITKHVIDGGVDYIVALGTTAESATLNKEEKKIVLDTIREENAGRLPIVLGIGGNNTSEVVSELVNADLKDVSAILSVSPYYNKPSQEGIYLHFSEVAKASKLPIILYNVPGRTSSNMQPSTVIRLAKDYPNIIGIKEASGDIVQGMKIIKNTPKDFLVISGDDMTALSLVLAGGAGVISVIGEAFPKDFSQMIRFGLEGNVEEAFKLQYKFVEIIDAIFEQGNPSGIKEVFDLLALSSNTVRLPLTVVDSDLRGKLDLLKRGLS